MIETVLHKNQGWIDFAEREYTKIDLVKKLRIASLMQPNNS